MRPHPGLLGEGGTASSRQVRAALGVAGHPFRVSLPIPVLRADSMHLFSGWSGDRGGSFGLGLTVQGGRGLHRGPQSRECLALRTKAAGAQTMRCTQELDAGSLPCPAAPLSLSFLLSHIPTVTPARPTS